MLNKKPNVPAGEKRLENVMMGQNHSPAFFSNLSCI